MMRSNLNRANHYLLKIKKWDRKWQENSRQSFFLKVIYRQFLILWQSLLYERVPIVHRGIQLHTTVPLQSLERRRCDLRGIKAWLDFLKSTCFLWLNVCETKSDLSPALRAKIATLCEGWWGLSPLPLTKVSLRLKECLFTWKKCFAQSFFFFF